MVQTPVHIISGFLGAGKTTTIIEIFSKKLANENWAILINEFGKISIDGQTLVSASAEGTVFEISGGCICCSAKAYFAENLEKIIGQNRFQRILIEPSGLGGIDHISDLVKQHSHLHLMPIVCVVDITMTNHPRLKKLPIYRAQIQLADQILFRKKELLELEKIEELKVQFDVDFPGKNYAGESFWDEFFLSGNIIQTNPGDSKFVAINSVATGNQENYKEFSLKVDGNKVIAPKILAELLKSEPSIVRAKGYIYTGFEWQLFNYTLTGFSTENCSGRTDGELVVIYLETEPKGFDLLKSKLENL